MRFSRSPLRLSHKDGAGLKTLRHVTIISVATCFLLGLLPSQVGARHGGEPPHARLKNNLGSQKGGGPTYGMGRRSGPKFCTTEISDGSASWPKALEHKRHRKLHLILRKNRKPTELSIDEDDGRGVNEIAYNLKPRKNASGDVVGWDARFRRPALGHHRLWVDVFWQGEHECVYDEATYMFHVKTIK